MAPFWINLLPDLGDFTFLGLIDIMVFAVLAFFFLRLTPDGTSFKSLIAIVVFLLLFNLSEVFNLELTSRLLESLGAALGLSLILLFQDEIKRYLRRVKLSLKTLRFVAKGQSHDSKFFDELVLATYTMAKNRCGALIVWEREEPVDHHLHAAKVIDSQVCNELILSVFDEHSAGHDGALVIRQGRVYCFGAHLPLSKHAADLGYSGTRHAAGLGISEKSDALAIIVSEERGEVSLALKGALKKIDSPEELKHMLKEHSTRMPTRSFLKFRLSRSVLRDISLSLLFGLFCWTVFIFGQRQLSHTVAVDLLVPGYHPTELSVTLKGPRLDWLTMNINPLKIDDIDTYPVHLESAVLKTQKLNWRLPRGLVIVEIKPETVLLKTTDQPLLTLESFNR